MITLARADDAISSFIFLRLHSDIIYSSDRKGIGKQLSIGRKRQYLWAWYSCMKAEARFCERTESVRLQHVHAWASQAVFERSLRLKQAQLEVTSERLQIRHRSENVATLCQGKCCLYLVKRGSRKLHDLRCQRIGPSRIDKILDENVNVSLTLNSH